MRKIATFLLALGIAALGPATGSAAATFPTRTDYNAGAATAGIAIGDVNLDGRPDVVATVPSTGRLQPLLNAGNGLFTVGATSFVGPPIQRVALADFNEDGRLDAVSSSTSSGSIWISRGNGNGTFQSAITFSAPCSPLNGIVAADFNNDAHKDVAAACPSGAVNVWRGIGNGSFQPPFAFGYPGAAAEIAVGTMNLDSIPDLVIGATSGATLGVMIGNGNGTFQSALIPPGLPPSVSGVAIVDFTGDARNDVVVSSASSSVAFMHQGTGTGSLLPSVPLSLGGPLGATAIATADFDLGGGPDIVTSNTSPTMSVLLRAGGGTTPTVYPARTSPARVAAGDLNADGAPDIVISHAGDPMISVYLNVNPPSAPQNPSAVAGPGAGQIKLMWQAPASNGGSPVTGYKIYHGTTSGSLSFLTTVGTVTSFIHSGLGNNATRFYAVSAVNIAGESPRSSEVSATTFDVPSAPVDLSATAGPAIGEVSLSWSAPASDGGTPVTGYRIYRGSTSGSETLLASVGNVTTFADGGHANGETFFYTVSAVNLAGEGAQSNESSATTFSLPTAPQNLTAAPGPGLFQVTLTWQPPASDGGIPVSYVICRSNTSGGLAFCTTPTDATTFTDGGLVPLATYYYTVYATNIVGRGPSSAESCSKPFPWVAELGCALPVLG